MTISQATIEEVRAVSEAHAEYEREQRQQSALADFLRADRAQRSKALEVVFLLSTLPRGAVLPDYVYEKVTEFNTLDDLRNAMYARYQEAKNG